MSRLLAALLAVVLLAALSGCETTSNAPSSRSNVSSIPWNRPAKWEGPGVLGGQLSSMQGY